MGLLNWIRSFWGLDEPKTEITPVQHQQSHEVVSQEEQLIREKMRTYHKPVTTKVDPDNTFIMPPIHAPIPKEGINE